MREAAPTAQPPEQPPPSHATLGESARDERALDPAPQLLPGIELGELDSGTTRQTYLLTMPDGRNFQIAGALYHLASLLDGQRTNSEVADALSNRIGRRVTADEVCSIVESKLAPLGILVPAGGLALGPGFGMPMGGGFGGGAGFGFGAPPSAGADAPLGIVARLPVLPARILEPLANGVKHLYHPLLALPILALILVAHAYAYQEIGPRLAEFNPLQPPIPLLLLLLGPFLAQLTTPWHELGHAAAARYFGARHGPLGVGFMGLMLVAFVEVTDIWRLPRWQRLVVDLGGVYFQSMAAILLAAWAWQTSDVTALWIVLMLDFAMLLNVNPLFKLDGYWAVSDATGIVNLHQRVGEQVRQVVAGGVLGLGKALRIGPLLRNERLQCAAAATHGLNAYGTGSRVAIALYSTLFVVTAIYFVFMFIMIVPVMVISYIPLSGLTLMSVHGLLSGTTNSIEMSVMVIIQFVFVNLMLVGLAAMVVPLIRMALGRRPRLPGWR
jgi:hypothetical protein